jgi:hypothetical protein
VSVHIVVPDERAEQLNALAEVYGRISIADTVGVLINREIAAGRLPDELPGFEIIRRGDEVSLKATGVFQVTFPSEAAKLLAALLRDERPQWMSILDPDLMLVITRRGSGLKIRAATSLAEKTLSLSVARDLGRLILGEKPTFEGDAND